MAASSSTVSRSLNSFSAGEVLTENEGGLLSAIEEYFCFDSDNECADDTGK